MELHAWLNPYRVTKGGESEWNSLTSSNPAKLHPDWTVKYSDGNYYLNPGLPEVRQLVIGRAVEIVNNYDVDGIHLTTTSIPGQVLMIVRPLPSMEAVFRISMIGAETT